MYITYMYIQNQNTQKKRNTAFLLYFSHQVLLLVAGLEPARGCPRGILSPLRLPIPPHQLTHVMILFKVSNGAYRARTYDPLLVRQMLSQLS